MVTQHPILPCLVKTPVIGQTSHHGLAGPPTYIIKLKADAGTLTIQRPSHCNTRISITVSKMSTIRQPPNIYIIGAQGTGKTTIVNEMERLFHSTPLGPSMEEPQIIREVARKVQEIHPIHTESIRSNPSQSLRLQKRIQAAQFEAEREALREGLWFISDRSGFDPIVYARRYVGSEAAADMVRSVEWLELRERMSASLVVVCEAGMGWLQDDGVRLMPEDREDWIQLHELFCEMLDEVGLQYFVLSASITDLSDRVGFVLLTGLSLYAAKEIVLPSL